VPVLSLSGELFQLEVTVELELQVEPCDLKKENPARAGPRPLTVQASEKKNTFRDEITRPLAATR